MELTVHFKLFFIIFICFCQFCEENGKRPWNISEYAKECCFNPHFRTSGRTWWEVTGSKPTLLNRKQFFALLFIYNIADVWFLLLPGRTLIRTSTCIWPWTVPKSSFITFSCLRFILQTPFSHHCRFIYFPLWRIT